MAIPITKPYYIVNSVISSILIFFCLLRLYEILQLSVHTPMYSLFLVVIPVAITMLFTHPSITMGLWMRKIGLLVFVIFQLKSELDSGLAQKVVLRDMAGSVVVVTGATAGIGKAVAKKFLHLNATVIIGCRSNTSCYDVSQLLMKGAPADCIGQVIPKSLDLNDLASIKHFADNIKKDYRHIDVLVNNAGSVPASGARTVQGLESSIGSMHVGHFALTRWLLEALKRPLPHDSNRPESSRIINVASAGYVAGSFDASLMYGTGEGDLRGEVTDNCPNVLDMGYGLAVPCCPLLQCPHTNGYARAKLANIMHMQELQRRLDLSAATSMKNKRRIVTSSLHPGSVSTEIHEFFSSPLTGIFLRTADQAANIVLYAALSDNFLPGSYLDSMGFAHDLHHYRDNSLAHHLSAYPDAMKLPFVRENLIQAPLFRIDEWQWASIQMVVPSKHVHSQGSGYDMREKVSPSTLAARLYDVSNQLIADFEKKRPLFSTPVLTSSDAV